MYKGVNVQLSGKVALVTGAAEGIGAETARAFARSGAKVVAADINLEGCERTAKEIRDAGGEALAIRVDVSKEAEVAAMVRKAVDTYGRLDCAFNNAGTEGRLGLLTDLTEEQWDLVLNTNLKGVWLCMKYELPQMMAQKSGAIVNTASLAGLMGIAPAPAYVASKHGIIGLTKSAALGAAPQGVRVNAVCPAAIETKMLNRFYGTDPAVIAQAAADHPVGRLGKPEDIAAAVLWLCSEAASFVTGHAMPVDGGYMAG
jgi:NAD(P)-dependent dehydrogenase (short-subunit alcohol dehydrogenase family)